MENEKEKTPEETLLTEIAATLRNIRGWMTFLGIAVLLGLIGGCIAAVTAFSGTASVLASFRSPCMTAYGIDYHAGYLYHGDGRSYIFKTNTVGSLLDTLPNGDKALGIDRTDLEFWTCNWRGFIYRLSTTGSILRTIQAPANGYGITYGEGCLWYAITGSIYKLTVNGGLLNGFYLPGSGGGICWDAPNLWVSRGNTIYKVTQSGSIIDYFAPKGAACGVSWDGNYLWYTSNNWVYKNKINFTGIFPKSLGNIKTLYR